MLRRIRSLARPVVLLTLVVPLLLAGPAAVHDLHAPRPAIATARDEACAVDAARIALDREEQALLDETNAYRAVYGLTALRPSYTLTLAALWKSNDMASREYFAHDVVLPEGSSGAHK